MIETVFEPDSNAGAAKQAQTDEVTVFHLEMTSPEQHHKKVLPPELTITEAQIKQARVNQFLYRFVGEHWHWHEKLAWSDQQWLDYAENKNLRTWLGYSSGSIAGYYELQSQPESSVELMYFGLGPASIGKGFGGALLSHAIESAWSWGKPKRIRVHTCSLDHKHALSNYQARGFNIFKQEIVVE